MQRHYGTVTDARLREFLRGEEPLQVFAPPPRSEGKVATTGPKVDWHVDIMTIPKGDSAYKHILMAQNVYTGYIFVAPLASTAAAGVAAALGRFLTRSESSDQGPLKAITTDGATTEWGGEFRELLATR